MIYLLIVAAGVLRGVVEGMVMYLPNVRDHALFGWYHALSLAVLAGFMWLAILMNDTWPGLVVTAGLMVLLWEAFEVGYMVSRFGGFVPYEHVVFADLFSVHVEGVAAILLHVGRVAACAVLLVIGR